MATINEKVYLDKLRACWIGKNIGGTIGAPYEGRRQLLSVTDFSKDFDAGPLPNDDLDLQLVWLRALEERGVKNFHANTLAEYWTDWIAPNWNEYGIAKTNLRAGLLPPMSGEVDNEKWKTSNGAWIRSELWAGLFPGATDLAARYAIYDACVDHGISDGTAAEVFTATLQSAAYFENDISVFEIGYNRVPPGMRQVSCSLRR